MEKVFNIFNMSTKPFLQDNEKSSLKSNLYRSLPNSVNNCYNNLDVGQLQQTIRDLQQELTSLHYTVQTLSKALLRASGEENI